MNCNLCLFKAARPLSSVPIFSPGFYPHPHRETAPRPRARPVTGSPHLFPSSQGSRHCIACCPKLKSGCFTSFVCSFYILSPGLSYSRLARSGRLPPSEGVNEKPNKPKRGRRRHEDSGSGRAGKDAVLCFPLVQPFPGVQKQEQHGLDRCN